MRQGDGRHARSCKQVSFASCRILHFLFTPSLPKKPLKRWRSQRSTRVISSGRTSWGWPRLFGHQQVTHAYLLALAIHHKGKLATLDQRVGQMLVDRPSERQLVEHIR